MSGTVNKCAVKKHPKFTEIYFEFLLFYYDSDGSATSFSYNGTMYFYVKNLKDGKVLSFDAFVGWAKSVVVKLLK